LLRVALVHLAAVSLDVNPSHTSGRSSGGAYKNGLEG
jgi:hypothetical protein